MYIIGLNGSPSEDGNTYYMLDKTLAVCAEKGAETEIISLQKALMSAKWPFCTACSTPCSRVCYAGTALEGAFEKLARADAVVIGSPVYFGTVSAQVKAFFDKSRYLRGQKSLIGKPCAALSVGASKYGGQENVIGTIHQIVLVHGMTIVGDGHPDFDAGHHGVAAQRFAEDDDFARERLKILGERLYQAAKLYNANR